MALQALSAVGTLTGSPIPTVAGVEASGLNTLTSFIQKGVSIGWFGLFVLAGGIPFPPFSYLGYGGLNLWAAGSMSYGLTKGALQAMLLVANKFLTIYYPHLWFVGYLLVLNPWYVFDLVQMFSPAFPAEGFKLPLLHTPIGKPGGAGTVSAALLAAAIGLLFTGTYNLINLFPPELVATYKPILNMVFLVVGGVTAIAGGGIGSVVVIPQIISALKTNAGEVSTGLASLPTAPQTGGGVPSLGEVAKGILSKNFNQSGGGSDPASTIFLGMLAVAALGGISLAVIRSKALPTAH